MKYEVIEDHGIYSELCYQEDQYQVALFLLSDFYVEVRLDTRTDKLKSALAFDNSEMLDIYLKDISIDLSVIS
jgi:hypothetical protein